MLKPHAPLSKEAFGGLSAAVDFYPADHVPLHDIFMFSRNFPGWESFAGFTAHMHFVHDHHKRVERVAIATVSPGASPLRKVE